jgi:hypothetical protein
MDELRTRFDMAGRQLQVAGTAVRKFARSSMREFTAAMQASREPMTTLLRAFRLAGRHIVRDATAAWREVAPAGRGLLRRPVLRGERRPA